MMTGPVANTDTPMSGRSQPSAKHRSTSCAAKAARGSCLRTRRRSARPKGSRTSRRPAAEGRQLARPTHVALVRTRPSGERPLRDRRAIVRSARTGDFGRTGGNPLGRAGSRGFRSGLQAASAAEVKADSWCPRQADAMSDLLQNGRSSRRLRTDEPPKSSYSGEGLGALDPHTAIAGLRAPRLSALRGRSLALTRFAGHFAA